MTNEAFTVSLEDVLADPDELKRAFKRTRIPSDESENTENWSIRMHRALSWYRKACLLTMDPEITKEMAEVRLILLWISLMSLAGRMDQAKRVPAPESECFRRFVDELASMDNGRLLADFTGRNKSVLMRLVTSPVLNMDFWQDPFDPALASRLERMLQSMGPNPHREDAPIVLKEALHRVFTLRGQIVHGGSTAGSKLNRTPLADGLQLLQQFLPMMLTLSLRCGTKHKWQPVCFPPVDLNDRKSLAKLRG